MQVSVDELTAEAGRMALELRFKDQAIAVLEAENARLREQVAGAGNVPPADQEEGANAH